MPAARPVTLASLALLLVLVAGCAGGGPPKEESSTEEAPPKALVRVEPAVLGRVSATLDSTATVDSAVRADLAVEVAGTVREVRVEEGDRVRRGQVLAVLDNPALAAQLRRAEVEAGQREREMERMRPLHERGYVATAEWEAVLKAHEQAQLALREARDSFAQTSLTSPIDGTVTARPIRVGENVTLGMPAFSVADLDRLIVEVHLPEREIGRVRPGQTALVRSEGLGGAEVKARVERLAPVVDPKTGTVKVTVALPAPEKGDLRPGMLVHVRIVAETREQAVLIPKKAVVYEEGRPFAWRIRDGRAERRALELGFDDRDRVEVRSGIEAGDRVVVVGQGSLKEGAEVEVVSANEAPGKGSLPAEEPPAAAGGEVDREGGSRG